MIAKDNNLQILILDRWRFSQNKSIWYLSRYMHYESHPAFFLYLSSLLASRHLVW